MAQQVQFRRGTTSQHGSFTGAVGEVTVDTDKDTLLVHDGSTAGGKEIASLAGTQTLTSKTLTSPVINTGTFGTSILPVSADGTTLGSASKEFSDLFLADGGTIQLGNDQDVTITHVQDTGILLNGSSKIQFTNSAESIHSDGSKLILTSNSVAFSLPTADGSNGQVLTTNGSGVLSFAAASGGGSSAADDITGGDAAVTITTSSGNITIDAAASDSDIIFKGTDDSSDITMLTLDGSAAGEATFNAGIVIADAGTIGSASDKDAIAISSGGVVTMNQIPVFSAGINVSGGTIAGTLATAAQTNITSLGTLTALQVDNLNLNGNTLSSTAGTDLLITPLAGQQIVLDGTIVVDAGVVTGATSITSTAFVGALTGTASIASAVVVADESSDTTCFPLFASGATSGQTVKSGSNLTFNSSTGIITATGFAGTSVTTNDITVQTSGTATLASSSASVLDSFASATFRSAKYMVSIKNTANSRFETAELLVVHDGTNSFIYSTGVSSTGDAMATYTTDIDSGNVRILVVPQTADSTVYKFQRTLIVV